jgi:hypothetical protein
MPRKSTNKNTNREKAGESVDSKQNDPAPESKNQRKIRDRLTRDILEICDLIVQSEPIRKQCCGKTTDF